jgi:hypothetical protein
MLKKTGWRRAASIVKLKILPRMKKDKTYYKCKFLPEQTFTSRLLCKVLVHLFPNFSLPKYNL